MSNSALLAALKSVAAGFTACPVYWPNERTVTPEPPSAFVWAEVTGLSAELLTLGTANASARHGFIRFHVMVPFGDAMEEAYVLADALGGQFAALGNAGGCQGLQTFAPTTPEIGATSDDGLWYGASVSVPWTYWGPAAA
jgi:Bacteriophage related domain of unknown function